MFWPSWLISDVFELSEVHADCLQLWHTLKIPVKSASNARPTAKSEHADVEPTPDIREELIKFVKGLICKTL
jgi:hypothetical protein